MIQLHPVRVETSSQIIEKALVESGRGRVVVRDRQRKELLSLDGDLVTVAAGQEWAVADWTITKMRGCGCGGTTVTDK